MTPADLRAYATLFWVGKAVAVGYVITFLQNKSSVAGVSAFGRRCRTQAERLAEVSEVSEVSLRRAGALAAICMSAWSALHLESRNRSSTRQPPSG